MKRRSQSSCPVCYALDVFGDKWTLLVIRDMVIGGKRRYRDFLSSKEGIATNILADRLKGLVEQGLAAKADDPQSGAQALYHPTAKAEALRPVLAAMAAWSAAHGPAELNRTVPIDAQASSLRS